MNTTCIENPHTHTATAYCGQQITGEANISRYEQILSTNRLIHAHQADCPDCLSLKAAVINCTEAQWGNDTMRRLAEHHFKVYQLCQFVLVQEHGGWSLGFRRDGSYWSSANDCATLDNGPQPAAYSHRYEYPDIV